MTRRTGSVEARGDVFRARYRIDGKLTTIGTFRTYAEADAALVLFAERIAEQAPLTGKTVAGWGADWLDEREHDGHHRSVGRDRHTWKRVLVSAFAGRPLRDVTTQDVRQWVAAQIKAGAARQTVANALNLLRVCLESACESGQLERNPARDVRVPKVAKSADKWTWLHREEVASLLASVDDEETRDALIVAIHTGMRAGELFGLEWRDVDLPRRTATVRHSWKGASTKTGETRTLHLFAPAVEAMERQRARSGKRSHVFPGRDGEPRTRDKTPSMRRALATAGITRNVRFHDLRHTCASHLISGSWGRAWTLEEVAKYLGHSTSATTRRYAHLCPEGLARAARETRPELHLRLLGPVPNLVPNRSQGPRAATGTDGAKCAESAEEARIELADPLPDRRFSKCARSRKVSRSSGEMGTVGERASALLGAMQAGKPVSEGAVAELAGEVLARLAPDQVAARRFVDELGKPGVAMAAVAFLAAAVEGAAGGAARADSG